jgi:uroporphyrin-III C-methyltransferase / precorrin-2 dehydrogenase / sirohydrochlorin ferrochelatase
MTLMPDQALCLDPASSAGVTLVGAGPGDPDLITIAGLKALLGADVVVTDRLVSHELLARLAPDVELIDVAKFPRSRFTAQEDINAFLLDRARAGKRVVRLKGGDSHVFGRGFEEVLHLQQAGVPVRVIPGLSSSISVPALAGIPVTHRGVVHDFTVVSGHVPPRHPDSLVNWDALAASRGTIVLMMAVQNAAAIAQTLIDGGRHTGQPAAVVVDGSMASERVIRTTLSQLGKSIETEKVRPPAIIMIGDVAGL